MSSGKTAVNCKTAGAYIFICTVACVLIVFFPALFAAQVNRIFRQNFLTALNARCCSVSQALVAKIAPFTETAPDMNTVHLFAPHTFKSFKTGLFINSDASHYVRFCRHLNNSFQHFVNSEAILTEPCLNPSRGCSDGSLSERLSQNGFSKFWRLEVLRHYKNSLFHCLKSSLFLRFRKLCEKNNAGFRYFSTIMSYLMLKLS